MYQRDTIERQFDTIYTISSLIVDESQLTLDLLEGTILPYQQGGLRPSKNLPRFNFFAVDSKETIDAYYDAIRDGFMSNLENHYFREYYIANEALISSLEYYTSNPIYQLMIERINEENDDLDEDLEGILKKNSYDKEEFIEDVSYCRGLFEDHSSMIKSIEKMKRLNRN